MIEALTVAPNQIEKALNTLWDTLEREGRNRASLFNLILFSKKEERGAYIHTLTKKIIEKFPSRVIFVSHDAAAEKSFLKTSVSMIAGSPERKDYACDFIEIIVGDDALKVVPFLVLPHLISDLPVYLVWTQDICKDEPIVFDLEKMATRLILDSEATDNLPCFAASALTHKERAKCDIADLNWARMESWRDLLASTFYPHDHLLHLRETKEITLTYNACPSPYFCHTRIQAIYLQAWLAVQLDWTLQKSDRTGDQLTFYYLRDTRPLTITLIPTQQTRLSPGTITEMHLKTEREVHFSFTRDVDFPHQVTLEISTKEQCYLPSQFVFAKGEAGGSLVKEVSHRGTSEHYLKVLKLISQLDGPC